MESLSRRASRIRKRPMAIAPTAIAPIAAAPRANAPTASARMAVLPVSIASIALFATWEPAGPVVRTTVSALHDRAARRRVRDARQTGDEHLGNSPSGSECSPSDSLAESFVAQL